METTNIYYGLTHNLKGVKGENKTLTPFIMFIKEEFKWIIWKLNLEGF